MGGELGDASDLGEEVEEGGEAGSVVDGFLSGLRLTSDILSMEESLPLALVQRESLAKDGYDDLVIGSRLGRAEGELGGRDGFSGGKEGMDPRGNRSKLEGGVVQGREGLR